MLPSIKIRVERWKWNENHEVWVSTEGRLRDRNKDLIEPMIGDGRYLVFFNEARQVFTNIHRVVLETWRPRDDMRQLTVEHKDQNRRNPALRNLMWLTPAENLRRAQYHDLGQASKTNTVSKTPKVSADSKKICANGVIMTIEDAVTFIYNHAENTTKNMSKIEMRTKINSVLNSNRQQKKVFGVTFTEVAE